MVEISTSLLSVEKDSVKVIYNLEVAHTDYYHIDVMDGKFVEANTSKKMLEFTNEVKQVSNIPIDVHLMVEDIDSYIEEYIPFAPDRITFHYEACKNREDVLKHIQKLKDNGIKTGISIKPSTDIEEIYEFLPLIHMVLVMTVEPGKGGQPLIEAKLDTIKKLRKHIKENDLEVDIEADGGINMGNIQKVYESGVDIAVVGTGILKTENYKETIKILKQKCN